MFRKRSRQEEQRQEQAASAPDFYARITGNEVQGYQVSIFDNQTRFRDSGLKRYPTAEAAREFADERIERLRRIEATKLNEVYVPGD